MKTTTSFGRDSADSLISKLGDQLSGVLHGFDRLRLRGTLRHLYAHNVMEAYLNAAGVLIKDFGQLVNRTSAAVRAATEAFAESWQRPVRYLPSSQTSKEEVARAIARKDGVKEGLIAVLSALEPCKSFRVVGNRQTKQIELKVEPRRCLHYYFYFEHPTFGFMHARLQTWFPFQIDVCLNGRHWLAKQLDAKGIAYRKRENAIIWCEDLAQAQRLLDEQVRWDWGQELEALMRLIHPTHEQIRRPLDLRYYWTVSDSEFASDLLFSRAQDLGRTAIAICRLFPTCSTALLSTRTVSVRAPSFVQAMFNACPRDPEFAIANSIIRRPNRFISCKSGSSRNAKD